MKKLIFLMILILCFTACSSTREYIAIEEGPGHNEVVAALLPDSPVLPHLVITTTTDSKFEIEKNSIEEYFIFKNYSYPEFINDVKIVIEHLKQ